MKCSQHLVVSPWEPQRRELGRTVVQGSRLAGQKGAWHPKKLECSDNWIGYCRTPSGPHPGWRKSRVVGRWQRHPDSGGLNLLLKRPGGDLICGERCRETIASCRRRHQRTGTGRSGKLRGWSRRIWQVTPYTGQEVLVGLRRGRRRKEVILVAWGRGHTVLEHGKEDPDWAETRGTGPDVTGMMEDGVPAITAAWVPRGGAVLAEGEGSSLDDRPK